MDAACHPPTACFIHAAGTLWSLLLRVAAFAGLPSHGPLLFLVSLGSAQKPALMPCPLTSPIRPDTCPQVIGSQFARADARGANLQRADLTDTNCYSTKVRAPFRMVVMRA